MESRALVAASIGDGDDSMAVAENEESTTARRIMSLRDIML
jgi:hypothetical protein